MTSVFGNFWKGISILLAMHYFFSYLIISKHLEKYGITMATSQITLEDVTFSNYDISLIIISYALSGVVFIVFIKGIFSIPFFNQKIRIPRQTFNFKEILFLIKKFKKCIFEQKNKRAILALLSIIMLVFFFLLYRLIAVSVEMIRNPIAIVLLILWIILPAIYFLYPKSKNYIIVFYLVGTFFWGKILIDKVFDNNNKEFLQADISFIYENEKITNSENCGLIWVGYKTYILYNTSSNTAFKYEVDKMSNIQLVIH